MPFKKPFASPFILAMAAAVTLNTTSIINVRAQQPAEAPKASAAEIKENNETVREITAPGKTVTGSDGTEHPSTGPAKPVESWMSACPPTGKTADAESKSEKKDCREPDDAGKAVKTQ